MMGSREGIPFWDEAKAGELCRIPCHNADENGDITVDCFNDARGTMTTNGLFRTRGGHLINPRLTVFVCPEHSGTGRPTYELIVPGDKVFLE